MTTSRTKITKAISAFLAKNRARNDASNRTEFLLSLSDKRRQLAEQGDTIPTDVEVPSCARTDARTVDRDVQMKYDIAKNEEGPLRKTVHPKIRTEELDRGTDLGSSKKTDINITPGVPTAERHPALDERLGNIEGHFAVKYGASA